MNVYDIWILFTVLGFIGILAFFIMLGDGAAALRRRIIGKKLAADEQVSEQIMAIENHKSAEDGSFDFD